MAQPIMLSHSIPAKIINKEAVTVTLDNPHKRLLDNQKTGVVVMDNDLRLLYLNVAAENLLEISVRKANKLLLVTC